jgi:hypothetical protein
MRLAASVWAGFSARPLRSALMEQPFVALHYRQHE